MHEGKFVVPSCSKWKHCGIQGKIRCTRLLTKRRHRLRRDICSQWELKHIHDELDEDINLFYKVEDESLYTRWIHRILVALEATCHFRTECFSA